MNAPEFDHGAGTDTKESGSAGQRSLATIKSSERLIEALQLADDEEAISIEHYRATKAALEMSNENKNNFNAIPVIARPIPSVQLLGKSPVMSVLYTLKYIKPSDLEEALLVLPFDAICKLLEYLEAFIESGESVELVAKCVFFILKVHHKAIIANRMLQSSLDRFDF